MLDIKLVKGAIYEIEDRGERYIAYYCGREKGFECSVCGKGNNAYRFIVWEHGNMPQILNELKNGTWEYELSFGKEHLPKIIDRII